MHIICLTPLEPGVYNDHVSDNITAPPDGWAMIPVGYKLPSTFPRLGSIEAEELTYIRGENGSLVRLTQSDENEEQSGITIMTVTDMTEGTLPDHVEPDETPTQLDRVEAQVTYTAMMTDTLLEV